MNVMFRVSPTTCVSVHVCVYMHMHTHSHFLWLCTWGLLVTTGGSTLPTSHRVQAESRAGRDKPFIHSFIHSVIPFHHRKCPNRTVPTGPRHSASFQSWVFSNKHRPQGKAMLEATGLHTTHFPVHSGKGLCQCLKYLWPHRRESGWRSQSQCWTVEGSPVS